MEQTKGHDYQFGHCHYFADKLLNMFKDMVPHTKVTYQLILGERLDNQDEVIDEVLIHVYVKINDLYLDSNGVNTIADVDDREDQWRRIEQTLTPEGYNYETWQEETDEIPDMFFNRFCNTKLIYRDIKKFLSNPEISKLILKLHDRKEKEVFEEKEEQKSNIDLLKNLTKIMKDDAKWVKCRNCGSKFTQTIHKGKKSLPLCPKCGTMN